MDLATQLPRGRQRLLAQCPDGLEGGLTEQLPVGERGPSPAAILEQPHW